MVYSLHINVRGCRSLPDFKETPSSDLRRRGHYIRGLSEFVAVRSRVREREEMFQRNTRVNLSHGETIYCSQ